LCTTGERSYPDPDLAAWIDRWHPDLVVCGHIHQAPWATGGDWVDQRGTTWLLNAGHQPGPMPAHVLIDTNADVSAAVAEWVALPDRARVEMIFADSSS
jgi:Icc-related predicted phosphoesterase